MDSTPSWSPTVPTGSAGQSYGLGVSIDDASKLGNISASVGHGGHLPGFFTNMHYLLKDGTVIVQIGNAELGKNYTGVLLLALYQ